MAVPGDRRTAADPADDRRSASTVSRSARVSARWGVAGRDDQ